MSGLSLGKPKIRGTYEKDGNIYNLYEIEFDSVRRLFRASGPTKLAYKVIFNYLTPNTDEMGNPLFEENELMGSKFPLFISKVLIYKNNPEKLKVLTAIETENLQNRIKTAEARLPTPLPPDESLDYLNILGINVQNLDGIEVVLTDMEIWNQAGERVFCTV